MAFTNPDPGNPVVLNVSVLAANVPSDYTRRFCKVSTGDTNITTGHLTSVIASEIDSIFVTTTDAYKSTETYIWLESFFGRNANGTAYIFETGTVTTIATNIAALATFLSDGVGLCYHYAVPSTFYGEATFKTLAALYATDISATYFDVEVTHGTDPAVDAKFVALAGLKSIFAIYPSAVAGESASGAMAGIMASTIYDLSSTNKNTMFQYKYCPGVTVEDLLSSFKTSLNNSAVNYIGRLISRNVVFNGRFLDNSSWDYWYAWDTIMVSLQIALSTALYNGSNSPSAVIQYNQTGIDKLLSVINGEGIAGKANGTINEFAESMADDGTTMNNTGTFYAVPFYTYIADNPTKYAAEIYDGLSGIIQIGRFYRKVVFNVTLA
jgi:hypothetical protein